MDKQYSRREILRAMMLGGGVIAGELWWPGKKLISIPTVDEVLRYTATERYSHGWIDGRGFGLAPTKAEGMEVAYDPAYDDVLPGNEEALVFSEDSLEQIVIDIRGDQKDFAKLSIKPTTITMNETFGQKEAKRKARLLASDQAHGERLDERIIRVWS